MYMYISRQILVWCLFEHVDSRSFWDACICVHTQCYSSLRVLQQLVCCNSMQLLVVSLLRFMNAPSSCAVLHPACRMRRLTLCGPSGLGYTLSAVYRTLTRMSHLPGCLALLSQQVTARRSRHTCSTRLYTGYYPVCRLLSSRLRSLHKLPFCNLQLPFCGMMRLVPPTGS